MKKLFYILFIPFLLFACVPEDHVLEIEIVNNTTEPVNELLVTTAGEKSSFEADVLPPGQKINHTLRVPGNAADGKYTFRFSRSNGEQSSTTGNYLEEEDGALKKTLVFNIRDQDVNVEQKTLEVE
ncbi:hypothetical protein [Salinimicrobium xinjiangense]|uniref:hypothetical protein n=1 Tax=Salinimicrobium xinjiangense TaxID=438596 RepID=UPI0012EB4F06|nr:hypothetical protein [Salinimicrobium xinjiangense]